MGRSRIFVTGIIIGAVIFLTSFSSVSAQAPVPAEAPGNDCFSALTNLSDCLTFVEAGSSVKKPDKGCCPAFAGLVESNPLCLCQLLGQSEIFGIKVNVTKAMSLPSTCRVSTPPASLCSVLGIPVGAPQAAGEGSISMTPGVAPSPKNKDNNGASSIRDTSLAFLLVGLSSVAVAIFF